MAQFIYTMKGLGQDLSARLGRLSRTSGSRFSTARRSASRRERRRQVDAAQDHGRARAATIRARRRCRPATRSATCRRSRSSIATKNVLGNVEEGVAPIRALLTRFDEINAKFGEELSPEEMDKVLEEQAKVQDAIEAAGAWDLDSKLEHAMDALRLPPADADVDDALGRRAAPRRAVPAAAAVARPAAARRADEPSRRRVGRLARALPARVPGLGRRHHARPLLPRQRRRLDSRARPHARVSVGRQLLVLARAEAAAARASKRSRRPSGSGRCSASSSGSACRRARVRRRARRA